MRENRAGCGRGGMPVGGAAGAAQHVLLTTGPQLRRGGLLLLTPPDDTGVMDWKDGEGIQQIQTAKETGVRMVTGSSIKGYAVSQSATSTTTEKNPKDELKASTDGEWISDAIEVLGWLQLLIRRELH